MKEGLSRSLDQLFETFRQNNVVDLSRVRRFFDQEPKIAESCSIFATKLSMAPKTIMNQQEFTSFFNQDAKQASHLRALFKSIDTNNSGHITRQQLTNIFKMHQVPVRQDELSIMLTACSQNGQRVTLQQLEKLMLRD